MKYVEVHLREGETYGWLGRPLYEEVVRFLWKNGVPGITVFRGEEGLDRKGHVQHVLSEYMSDALPVSMHMVMEAAEQWESIVGPMRSRLQKHDYFLFVTDAADAKNDRGSTRGAKNMEEAMTLKVYMKEEDRFQDQPLYHALVLASSQRNVLWVHVQRALEGFGKDRGIRRNKVFQFASHSPVLVEVTGTTSQIEALVREIQPLLQCASGPAILLRGQFAEGRKT
jgi:PII-like signaling protein